MSDERFCAAGCGTSMEGRRADAKTCGDACRKALSRGDTVRPEGDRPTHAHRPVTHLDVEQGVIEAARKDVPELDELYRVLEEVEATVSINEPGTMGSDDLIRSLKLIGKLPELTRAVEAAPLTGAEGIIVWADIARHAGDIGQWATENKLRCEREAGRLLHELHMTSASA